MLTFGTIAEGETDQAVIENLILGYFEEQADDVWVSPVQPLRNQGSHGGWTNVFNSLRRLDYKLALRANQYLVIHIDTDVQEHAGFDVPMRVGMRECTVDERVQHVVDRIKREMDATFFRENEHRFLFAVCVDSMECWLLPLLYTERKDAKKAGKTTGCLDAANHKLRTLDLDALGTPEKKFPDAYERVSHGFLKRKTLLTHRAKNPSLNLFIHQLDALQARISSSAPAAPPIANDADSLSDPPGEDGDPPKSP